VKQGEVWTIAHPRMSATRRVVVLSGDIFNDAPNHFPYVVPVIRRAAREVSPFVTPLGELDPVSGIVVTCEHARMLPPMRPVELVGMLTGATMAQVFATFRDIYEF
jgi:mRNA interferase MazF